MAAKTSNRWWIAVAIVVPLVMGALLSYVSERGIATRADGIPAVARVAHTADGSCIVGIKRHHCYQLTFEVLPEGEPPFVTRLDVNVADQWASRVQPGSLVWVVRDPKSPREVALAVEAFAEPAPHEQRGELHTGQP